MTEAVQAPVTPSSILTGEISRLEGNAIVIGKDSLFINTADISGVKVFDEVEYEKEGPNLKRVKKKAPTSSAQTSQIKEGQTILKSVHLDDPRPHVILISPKGEFTKLVQKDDVSSQLKDIAPGKFIKYSTNKEAPSTPIKSIWEVDADGKSVKSRTDGSWRNQRKSPEDTRSIELQSCFRTCADVYIAFMGRGDVESDQDFGRIMNLIRNEAQHSADWIRQQAKMTGGSS